MQETKSNRSIGIWNQIVILGCQYPTTGKLWYKCDPKRKWSRPNSKHNPKEKNAKRNNRNVYTSKSRKLNSRELTTITTFLAGIFKLSIFGLQKMHSLTCVVGSLCLKLCRSKDENNTSNYVWSFNLINIFYAKIIFKMCSLFWLKKKIEWKQCIIIKHMRWIFCYLLLQFAHWPKETAGVKFSCGELVQNRMMVLSNWFLTVATTVLIRFYKGLSILS